MGSLERSHTKLAKIWGIIKYIFDSVFCVTVCRLCFFFCVKLFPLEHDLLEVCYETISMEYEGVWECGAVSAPHSHPLSQACDLIHLVKRLDGIEIDFCL